MRIGELAAQANVNVQTVRLYERLGLLQKPERLSSGYRNYSTDAVLRVQFIKRAQKLGFTLTEIRTLLELRAEGRPSAETVSEIAAAKIAAIDQKIAHLQEMRNAIEHGISVCRCRNPYPLCLLAENRNKARP